MKLTYVFVFILLASVASSFSFASCAAPSTGNQQLSIQGLNPVQNQTLPGGTVVIQSNIVNPGGGTLTYKWTATGGGFGGSGANNIWQAPAQEGAYTITLTVEDGKGGYAQANTSVSVTNNRAPIISSLTTEPRNVTPGGSVVVTCTANDPDGDIVRYSWNTSDGVISGSGNKVSWSSPNKNGDFGITCVVGDGKGGESKQTVTVNVSPSSNAITISLVKQESGTVSSNNDKDITRYRAGDDDKNAVYRAFYSYDIFGLNKTNVRLAKLKFAAARVTGDPFNALEGLRIWRVTYGGGLPDYNVTGDNLYYAGAVLTKLPVEIDVTPEIKNLIAAGSDRFQIEALFYKATNANNSIDYIEWPDVTLEVTFAP